MISSSLSYKRLRILFALTGIMWSALHASALLNLGWDWRIAMSDSLLSNLLLAAACFATVNSLRYYTPGKSNWVNLLLYSAVLAGVCVIALKLSLSYLHRDDPSFLYFLTKSIPIRYGLAFLMIGWVVLLVWLWRYIINQKEADERRAYSEKLAREAELHNLRQQLQPHFLFNSLNSISALIGSRPQEARTMVQHLSDFLRGTMKKDDQVLVSLKEELAQLNLYLEIEKVRFGHRLVTEISIQDGLAEVKLPSLLLQPVVENAIKFGLYDTSEAVTITISAVLEGEFSLFA